MIASNLLQIGEKKSKCIQCENTEHILKQFYKVALYADSCDYPSQPSLWVSGLLMLLIITLFSRMQCCLCHIIRRKG